MAGGDGALLAALPTIAFAFVLILCRLGALLMVAPGLGEAHIPVTMRAAIAAGLTLLLLPALAPTLPQIVPDALPLAAMIGGELIIGVWIGWLARLVALALPAAATIISFMVGLSSVLSVDSSGAQVSSLARLFGLIGPLLVLTTGLYALPLAALLGSYRLFTPGAALPSGGIAQVAMLAVAGSFAIALQLAAPFVVAGTVWQVALGLLARLVPNLQVFLLALPGQVLGGLVLMSLLLAGLLNAWLQWTHTSFAVLPGA